ncbi:MAG: tryptophan 2,3-dioxygenase, partial [Betaproteobacteria bacterium]
MSGCPVHPTDPASVDGAELDFAGTMSYGDYLHLDAVLGAQHPLSGAHDEMLFIGQPPPSGLGRELMLHARAAASAAGAADDLHTAY